MFSLYQRKNARSKEKRMNYSKAEQHFQCHECIKPYGLETCKIGTRFQYQTF
jgi:hypothetical protein